MPIGDSLTYGVIDSDDNTESGGYRTYLWKKLIARGYNVDFVGSQENGPDSIDRDHEGYRGQEIDDIADSVSTQIAKKRPDVVLLLAGINDINHDQKLSEAPQRLGELVNQILKTLPKTTVFVGTLPPNTSSSNNSQQIRAFNTALLRGFNRKSQYSKKVRLVDLHRHLTSHDLSDGTHLTAKGYQKMAGDWYDALVDVLGRPTVHHPAHKSNWGSRDPLTGSTLTLPGTSQKQPLQSSWLVGEYPDRLLNFNQQTLDQIWLDFDRAATSENQDQYPIELSHIGRQTTETLKQAIKISDQDISFYPRDAQKLKPHQALLFQYKSELYLSVNHSKLSFQAVNGSFADLGQLASALSSIARVEISTAYPAF
ncbi:MAG TPA: SGNH/GDSL hydrolase family protein [Allocoleopsis sp.]